MDRVTAVNYCLGLLGLLALQGVISVEGRSIFTSGNHVFSPRENTDIRSRILALVLHRSSDPLENEDPLGLIVGNKLVDLEELHELREDVELERKIAANLAGENAITRKRGEPCFWKYCV
ncbi:urotensin 2 domain containing [Nothobranchius furzeri]|uniref:urotensin 2 domain containing n=1 Tax=Nothobranchius furzeri TaxID=105023 RepID=UPI002403D232|nr:urotensin 2 domain containing [Nothobranchius furzeri]